MEVGGEQRLPTHDTVPCRRRSEMSRLIRILAAALLLGVTGFCAYGFLSAPEVQGAVAATQFLYAVIGLVSACGAGLLAWPSRPVSVRILVLALLTPLLGSAGFVVGVIAAGVLGALLHDNYEFFGPSVSLVGAVLAYGGALVGLGISCLVALIWRQPGSSV
jgi:hypothetical protein